jgi:hypothetical protein
VNLTIWPETTGQAARASCESAQDARQRFDPCLGRGWREKPGHRQARAVWRDALPIPGCQVNALRYFRPLGYAWALPHTILGLVLALWYWPSHWRWSEGALEAVSSKPLLGGRWVAGQTWGWLIFYRDLEQWVEPGIRVHERVHVTQALVGGPLYPVAYVLHWLILWPRYGWKEAYLKIWAEKAAYKAQARGDQ